MFARLSESVCYLLKLQTCWLQYLQLWLNKSCARANSCPNTTHTHILSHRKCNTISHGCLRWHLVTLATDIILLASSNLFIYSLRCCGLFPSFSILRLWWCTDSVTIQLRQWCPHPYEMWEWFLHASVWGVVSNQADQDEMWDDSLLV